MTDGFVQVAADGAGKKIDNSEIVVFVPVTVYAWQAGVAYTVGQFIRPVVGNGHYYKCMTAGIADAVEPNWPTANAATVADGSVVWTEQNTVERQRINIADPTDPLGLAEVMNSDPIGDEYGQVVREVNAAVMVQTLQAILVIMNKLEKVLERRFHV